MEKNSQLHLSTGEFAKMMGISKETLFHYDEIKVFSPEFRADNGYRYYSVYQIEPFQVIMVLKELGMPLKEIKAYLDKRSPLQLIELLQAQSEILGKKIRELTFMKALITKKAQLTKAALDIDFNKVAVVYQEKELFVTTPLLKNISERAAMIKIAEHWKMSDDFDIYSPYSMGSILPVKNARLEKYMFYSHYYTRVDAPIKGAHMHEKPSGSYVVSYHHGGYNTLDVAYKRLLAYIDENNLALGENFYEDVLLDELSNKGYDNFVMRIEARVLEQ